LIGVEQKRVAVNNPVPGAIASWIDRALLACLFLFVIFAPNTIALTQLAWLLGLLFWVLRLALYPRRKLYKTPLDYGLLAFFILTGLSSFLSYEPLVSIGKLRAANLFTIVYLFGENIPSRRVLRLLALALLASCAINVVYTLAERVIGKGVKVQSLKTESALYVAGARAGDTLLEIDGRRVEDLDGLVNALSVPGQRPAVIKAYRHELLPVFKVERGTFLPGTTPGEKLGIDSWSRGRDWRASGFYGHYTTYSETLQLIGALAIGLFVSLPHKRNWIGALFVLGIAGLLLALTLTVTRASWIAFLVSSAVILIMGLSRKVLLVTACFAMPLIIAGLLVLQQKRNVGFFDRQDGSTSWREIVWREGFELLLSKPRHLIIGIGMDSLKGHWREWGMFDHGRLPPGHMHSNILQIALERGVPALIVWLLLLGLYARMLLRVNKHLSGVLTDHATQETNAGMRPRSNLGPWIERGIILGALGGLCGFFLSGLVHYNWGDSEVVMIFYLIMGLTLVVQRTSSVAI